MLKITFIACGDIYDKVYSLTLRARQWLNEQGIDFDANFVHGDKPTEKDFEDLQALGKTWKILNKAFYKKQVESKLNYDTDICVFCYSPDGTSLINIAEPTTIFRMTMAQCIIDSDDAWYYIRHELIHCFHWLALQQGFPVVDNQDAREQLANAYYTADNETKQQIEKENLQDILPYWNKLKPNKNVSLVITMLQSVVALLTQILNLKKNTNPPLEVLEKLAHVIEKQEGFWVDDSLAFKNKNPGNLMFVGQKGATKSPSGFCKFESYGDGFRALLAQLTLVWNNQSRYYPKDCSILQFVNAWASTSPLNERDAYAKAIADAFRVSVDYQLNKLKI